MWPEMLVMSGDMLHHVVEKVAVYMNSTGDGLSAQGILYFRFLRFCRRIFQGGLMYNMQPGSRGGYMAAART